MKCIFTTTGTSLISKILAQYEDNTMQEEFDRLSDKYEITDFENEEIQQFMKEINKNWDISLSEFSAETNSLNKMLEENLVNPQDDYLFLLHSDTLDGYISTIQLEKVLKNRLHFIKVEKRIMKYIKTNDAETFGKGLKNLRNIIADETRNRNFDEIIYNITGSYKGVAAAITVTAIYNSPIKFTICYLYQNIPNIVRFAINEGEVDLRIGNFLDKL
ncbi:MAG: hypothetical protein K9N07_10160 [Candidatus Cloacimonetes bacterium]|nr:hypothetical protein [Candidatus Cloacimonadota bacterium]